MFELIRSHDSRYDEYEKLLLERDKYRKDAKTYLTLYIHEFGELITAVFRIKVSCIEKKKTIAFCRMYINRDERIDASALKEYIDEQMETYYDQLRQMAADNELCKELRSIPEAEYLEIKSIYRRIAKALHPDLNPLTEDNEELSELWSRTAAAYNSSDLKELRELEVLVNAVLSKLDGEHIDVEIPDIGDKIEKLKEEIERITSTDPYMYKHLLDSDELKEEKKEELRKELKEYSEYEKELKDILRSFIKNGAEFTWETEN